MGVMLTGCGPEPVSMVKITPVTALPTRRLVMLTLRNTERLPSTMAPAVPPEQFSAMSPVRSARPSPFTMGGTALSLQVRIDALENPNMAKVKTKHRKNGRDMLTSLKFPERG